jgi:hypothetical protein
MIDLSDHVRITNGTNRVIRGRFDGVDYVFPPKKPVDVHVNVARHVFGFDVEDKSHAMARLGWMTSSDQTDAAYAELAKVKFDAVPDIPGSDYEDEDEDEAPTSEDRAPRVAAARKGSASELAPSSLPVGSTGGRAQALPLGKPPQEDDGRL